MADRVRMGVVGTHAEQGRGRTIHLQALRALNDFQSYDDARTPMADPDIDLIIVAVQLPAREGLVEAAIARDGMGTAIGRERPYGCGWAEGLGRGERRPTSPV
ncbi:hypothetical protein ACIRJM_37215 [Streptomyces sp. NPDC102405]|uniref:hypothetical protein n=1 Tax=Streptomyces sp. NPDC102405 TaxID=3366170 RepID=UPI0037F484C5